jgi:hypothetical protein
MDTLTSTSIIRGPAIVTHDGATHYSEGDIIVTFTEESVALPSSAFGEVDTLRKSVVATIKFTPLMYSAALAAKLWPYAATTPGTMLCGAVDKPLVIHTLAGTKYTFARAALTKMPGLKLAVDQSLIGEVEYSAVVATGADLVDADAILKVETAAFADTSFDRASILRGPWAVTLGSTTLYTEAGITIDFAMQTNPEAVDGMGIIDWSMKDVTATASFVPVGLSHADWLALQKMQGAGNGIGSRGSARGLTLGVAGTGFALALTGCSPTSGETRFGDARLPGTLQLKAHRTFTSGARNALWTLGAGA